MSGQMDRLVRVVSALRRHCLWTAALTHESLVEYLVEEAYELVEAIEEGHPDAELKGELADVLFQVVLHAAIADERGAFALDDVAGALADKMVRRNRHVFEPDGSLRSVFPDSLDEIIRSWDAAKRAERPERTSPFEGLPKALPALALADKTLGRATRWEPDAGVTAASEGAGPATEEELGELLLGVVRDARSRGLDAERALRTAVGRYTDGDGRPPDAT